MKDKLNIHYDAEGDMLEIRLGDPTNSYFEELGNDVFKRKDEKTGETTGFAIFNFKKKSEKGIDVTLPVNLEIKS